jgi:MFS family permease
MQRTLNAMLRTSHPVPARGDEEVAAEIRANYRWNFAVNLGDGATFWFGMSFISATTIIPLYVSKLTSNPLAIGLVAVIAQGAWWVPQLFTANGIQRLPRMKPVVINLGLFLERLPVWLMVATAFIAGRLPTLALALFLLIYTWRGLGSGSIAPAWQELLARCFPANRRGRLLGITNFLGTGAGAFGAGLSTWLLTAFAFPLNFVYTFGIAAVAITVSWVFLALTREPGLPPPLQQQSSRGFLAQLPSVLRRERNFRRFLTARSLMAAGNMGLGFVTVTALARWQLSDGTVGLYTVSLWFGQAVGYPVLGLMADRFGNKLSLELGALASTIAFTLAWLAPSPEWIFVVFVLMGINLSAILGPGILVAFEFSGPQHRPTFVGITNTTVGLVNIAAPMLGAWLVGFGHGVVFALSAAFCLLALIAMRWWVREPRWTVSVPAAEA